jgi:hypothetical protein
MMRDAFTNEASERLPKSIASIALLKFSKQVASALSIPDGLQ